MRCTVCRNCCFELLRASADESADTYFASVTTARNVGLPSAPVPERTTQTTRAPKTLANEFSRKSNGNRAP